MFLRVCFVGLGVEWGLARFVYLCVEVRITNGGLTLGLWGLCCGGVYGSRWSAMQTWDVGRNGQSGCLLCCVVFYLALKIYSTHESQIARVVPFAESSPRSHRNGRSRYLVCDRWELKTGRHITSTSTSTRMITVECCPGNTSGTEWGVDGRGVKL
jgi:hypothetical protein